MNGTFWLSYVLLWILIVMTMLLVLLLYRQFGLMLMPGRQRLNLGGLNVGALAPVLPIDFIGQRDDPVLDWRPDRLGSPERGFLVLFALAGCPICKKLWERESLDTLQMDAGIQYIWVDQRPDEEHLSPPRGWLLGLSPDLTAHSLMEIPAAPFAYALRPGGEIVGKALINSREDIGRLLIEAFSLDALTSLGDEPDTATTSDLLEEPKPR